MNQIERIKSLANICLDTIWRNRLLVLILAAVCIAAAIPAVNSIPRQYMASVNVLGVNGNTRDDPTLSSPDLPSIATSTVVLDRVIARLHLDLPLIAVKHSVSVKTPAYKSSLMRIEYVASKPDRAELIANGIANELIAYFSQVSTAQYDSELRALDAELAKQRARIKGIDAQVKARGSVPSLTSDQKGDGADMASLGSLETDRELTNAVLTGDQERLRAGSLDDRTRAKIFRRDVLKEDERYQDLMTIASTGATQLANDRAVYTSMFPALAAVAFKVRSLDSATQREAQRVLGSPDAYSPTLEAADLEQRKAAAVVAADRAKLAALDNLIDARRARLDSQAPLALLQLERSAAQADYLAISSHRATALANRADALSLGSLSVVDRAIATEVQSGLSRKAMLAALVFVSLILAIGSAFIADALNPRLRRLSQIENLYGQEVIATLGIA